MKNENLKIIIQIAASFCFFISMVSAREFYITPDGETVYYSPAPRVFMYKPKSPPERIFSVFVPNGKEQDKVLDPRDIYVDHKDRVFVTDAGEGMVKVFTALGSLVKRIDLRSIKSEENSSPGAVAASPLGEIYVADTSKRKIQVFDITGRSQGTFSPTNEREKIDFPEDFVLSRDLSLLILDSEKSRIHRYSFKKEWIDSWGVFGDKTGEINHPGGFSLGRNEDLYIADTQNHRIDIFWPNGILIRSFGIKGQTPGMLNFPHTIAVDPNGLIAVGDRGGARIQFFTPLGNFRGEILFNNKDSGSMEVKAESITFDGIGSLYIIDGLGKRVLKIPPIQINEVLD
jgi:sugar lactone lactonase YvrE